MMEIHRYMFKTGTEVNLKLDGSELFNDDIADEIISQLNNKKNKTAYYWGVKIFKVII